MDIWLLIRNGILRAFLVETFGWHELKCSANHRNQAAQAIPKSITNNTFKGKT